MSQLPFTRLTPLQQTILEVVGKYSHRFYRSDLAKLLVGAKSWPDKELPEYGCFSSLRRKDVLYQIDILLQQSYLALDAFDHLIVPQE